MFKENSITHHKNPQKQPANKNWKSYRKTFFSEDELQESAIRLVEPLADLRGTFARGQMSEPEFVSAYIYLFLKNFYDQDPRQGLHGMYRLEQPGFFASFVNRQIRSIPQQVVDVLYQWHLGKYPLRLLFYVPDLEEVLTDQAQGVRCVTCVTGAEEIIKHVENGRDALSFCLHDLRHAHHFFSVPELIAPQIGYSKWMLWGFKNNLFTEHFANQEYKNAWEYGATDMNSHPIHILKYTKAVADINLGKEASENLWREMIPEKEIFEHFQTLNSKQESEAAFQSLILWLSKK